MQCLRMKMVNIGYFQNITTINTKHRTCLPRKSRMQYLARTPTSDLQLATITYRGLHVTALQMATYSASSGSSMTGLFVLLNQEYCQLKN